MDFRMGKQPHDSWKQNAVHLVVRTVVRSTMSVKLLTKVITSRIGSARDELE